MRDATYERVAKRPPRQVENCLTLPMTFFLFIKYFDHGAEAIVMADSLRLLLNDLQNHPELIDDFRGCKDTSQAIRIINNAQQDGDSSPGYQLFEVYNNKHTTLIAGS
jgi:hypothetical protein